MPIKKYKPTTPSRRFMTTVDFSMLTKDRPRKKLTKFLKKSGGRNNRGVITVRHRGGGSKRLYRLVDFKRNIFDVEGEVKTIEYDPNRTAFIVLIEYSDGKKSYILAPEGIKVGDKVMSSLKKIESKIGNRLPLKFISTSAFVYNIEFSPRKGGQMVKSAGAAAQLLSCEDKYAQLKLPSGEIRNVLSSCLATVGRISNVDHTNIILGKAGRVRRMGIRPTVRGKAMNPKDHPHGGGEGRAPIGLVHPKTPWGKTALGVKTRKKGKRSDRLIVKRRK